MVSCAKKDPEIIPLTWKNCWKVAVEIREFWPENEGKNEATVLDYFSADRPHGIHAFCSRKATRNHPFDLENLSESGPQNSDMDGKIASDEYRLF